MSMELADELEKSEGARWPRGWGKNSGATGGVLSFDNESTAINKDGSIDNDLLMRDA